MRESFDVVCIGGGVIGLMTALELAQRGQRVAVIDRQQLGQEASWAGAGIIPPAYFHRASSAMEKLRAVSFETYPRLASALREWTGLDIELLQTGGIEVAETRGEAAELAALVPLWRRLGITAESLSAAELAALEPSLAPVALAAYRFAEMHQIRNPRLMRALLAACVKHGVILFPGAAVRDFGTNHQQVHAVTLQSGTMVAAEAFVLTAGAWSATLLQGLGVTIPVRPVQGQMVAIQTDNATVRHIVMVGKKYFVPRQDGLVLVGSTEEDVGFAKGTTESGVRGLIEFAYEYYPSLKGFRVARTWAGLRPGLDRGFPMIGRVPGYDNFWLATGHFRQGIQLAPGTARLLADWITTGDSFATESDFAIDSTSAGEQAAFRS